VKREVYKFLSGFLAGAGVVHANIGFAIVMGMFNEPHYLGRTWSATALWVGASVYLIASLVLGYLGWRTHAWNSPVERLQDKGSQT
jgi:hypothetical protein